MFFFSKLILIQITLNKYSKNLKFFYSMITYFQILDFKKYKLTL